MAISERLALLVTLDARGAIKSFNDVGAAAEKNLSKADNRLDRMGSKFQKAGAGMLATAGLLGAGLYKAGQAAADLEQAVGGTEAVFGEASDAIDEYAKKAARSAGLSESAFRQATTSIGGQLKGLGFSTGEAADQAVKLSQVAADLAATYGGTTADAVAALGSAFRGEADPAERFNLFLNQNRVNAKAVELGLAATTSEVDAHAKAQATLALILEQSADAQGQFARESGTAAGQMAIANAEFENAKASLGQAVAPVIGDLAGGLADLAGGFTRANEASGGFLSKLTTFGAVGLGAAGALSFTVGKLIDMRDTLAPLGGRLRTAEGGLTKMGAAAAAVPLAGLAVGLIQVGREMDGFNVKVGDVTGAFASMDRAAQAETQQMLELAEASGGLDDLIGAVADSSVPAAERLLEFAEANGFAKGEIDDLKKIIDDKRDSDVQGAQDQAAYTTEIQNATNATSELTPEIEAQKEALDLATESADKFKDGIKEAFGDLTIEEAADRRAQAFSDMAQQFADAQDAVRSAKQRVSDLLATPVDDRSETFARDLAEAQRAVDDAIAETSRTLDGNSEAALRNRESIRGAVEDVAGLIQAHRDEGDSLEELEAIRDAEKANLERQLEQLGFNREEIGRYIGAIDAIPITKDTTITVDTAPAQLRIKELAESLTALAPSQQFSIDAAVIDRNLQRAQTRRAIGGPVTAGEGYSVNEYLGAGKGFEWFAPSNGTISPSGPAGANSYAFDVTINNPVPEPASTSIGRLRRVSLEVASR